MTVWQSRIWILQSHRVYSSGSFLLCHKSACLVHRTDRWASPSWSIYASSPLLFTLSRWPSCCPLWDSPLLLFCCPSRSALGSAFHGVSLTIKAGFPWFIEGPLAVWWKWLLKTNPLFLKSSWLSQRVSGPVVLRRLKLRVLALAKVSVWKVHVIICCALSQP